MPACSDCKGHASASQRQLAARASARTAGLTQTLCPRRAFPHSPPAPRPTPQSPPYLMPLGPCRQPPLPTASPARAAPPALRKGAPAAPCRSAAAACSTAPRREGGCWRVQVYSRSASTACLGWVPLKRARCIHAAVAHAGPAVCFCTTRRQDGRQGVGGRMGGKAAAGRGVRRSPQHVLGAPAERVAGTAQAVERGPKHGVRFE